MLPSYVYRSFTSVSTLVTNQLQNLTGIAAPPPARPQMDPTLVTPSASERAVSFSFLKEFIQQVPEDYTTANVVFNIIVPHTSTEMVNASCR